MNSTAMKTVHRYSLTYTFWLCFVSLMVASQTARAEQKEDFGDFEIHYSAFVSTFLTPEVAAQYQLKRSKAIGVVNISVLRKNGDSLPTAVGSGMEGLLTNDVQQQRPLSFRRITEGKAIYYIAEFQFVQSELLTFNITAYPDGSSAPLKLRFTQHFYND